MMLWEPPRSPSFSASQAAGFFSTAARRAPAPRGGSVGMAVAPAATALLGRAALSKSGADAWGAVGACASIGSPEHRSCVGAAAMGLGSAGKGVFRNGASIPGARGALTPVDGSPPVGLRQLGCGGDRQRKRPANFTPASGVEVFDEFGRDADGFDLGGDSIPLLSPLPSVVPRRLELTLFESCSNAVISPTSDASTVASQDSPGSSCGVGGTGVTAVPSNGCTASTSRSPLGNAEGLVSSGASTSPGSSSSLASPTWLFGACPAFSQASASPVAAAEAVAVSSDTEVDGDSDKENVPPRLANANDGDMVSDSSSAWPRPTVIRSLRNALQDLEYDAGSEDGMYCDVDSDLDDVEPDVWSDNLAEKLEARIRQNVDGMYDFEIYED